MQYNGTQIFQESAIDCNIYVPSELCPSVTSSYKDSEISHVNHFVLWDISMKCKHRCGKCLHSGACHCGRLPLGS